MSRSKFDRQFKISAVKRVQKSGYSRAEAANAGPTNRPSLEGSLNESAQLDGHYPISATSARTTGGITITLKGTH